MKFYSCENCKTLLRSVDLKEYCGVVVCPACGYEIAIPPIVLSVEESERYEHL